MSMNGGVAASRQSAAGWLFRRTAALCRDAATGDGSWAAFIRFCACIGTMNQIGTPLPALSPQGGERVAEGRQRGGSWAGNAAQKRWGGAPSSPHPQRVENRARRSLAPPPVLGALSQTTSAPTSPCPG